MKRCIIVLIAFFYLLVSTGLAVNLHYCGGKIKSISFFQNKDAGCCGSEKKSKGCCKNKHVVHQFKEKHSSPPSLTKTPIAESAKILFAYVSDNVVYEEGGLLADQYYYPPPLLYSNPVYLRNRVLII